MAQWGVCRITKGMKVIPLVDTTCFSEIEHDFSNAIVDFYVLDTPYSSKKTEKKLQKIKDKYIGKPYKGWEKKARELEGIL